MKSNHEHGQPKHEKALLPASCTGLRPGPGAVRGSNRGRAHELSHGPPGDPLDQLTVPQPRAMAVPQLTADAEWRGYSHLVPILQPQVFGVAGAPDGTPGHRTAKRRSGGNVSASLGRRPHRRAGEVLAVIPPSAGLVQERYLPAGGFNDRRFGGPPFPAAPLVPEPWRGLASDGVSGPSGTTPGEHRA